MSEPKETKNPAPAIPVRAPNPTPTPRMPTIEPPPGLPELPGAPVKLKVDEAPPPKGSLLHWSLKHKLPEWLHAAMAVGRPGNALYSEAEVLQLAHEIAGLPLGRKVS